MVASVTELAFDSLCRVWHQMTIQWSFQTHVSGSLHFFHVFERDITFPG
jgi:hypothetical protein